MKNKPLVSVVIPVYNGENYIEEAVNSISQQTYKNIEIIIINDASTDKTSSILEKLQEKDKRIVVFNNEKNLKIVGSLNKGLVNASGKYISRMDCDDIKLPSAIEKQVIFLEKNNDIVVVGGSIEVCDENMNKINERRYPLDDDQIRAAMFRFNPFAHPAVMIRASAVAEERYQLNWAEDYDMWFRLGLVGKLANLDEVVLKLRTHSGSISQTKLKYQEKLTLFIRERAVFEYGYKMTITDRVYNNLQKVSSFIMPTKVRFYLFNFVRKYMK